MCHSSSPGIWRLLCEIRYSLLLPLMQTVRSRGTLRIGKKDAYDVCIGYVKRRCVLGFCGFRNQLELLCEHRDKFIKKKDILNPVFKKHFARKSCNAQILFVVSRDFCILKLYICLNCRNSLRTRAQPVTSKNNNFLFQ